MLPTSPLFGGGAGENVMPVRQCPARFNPAAVGTWLEGEIAKAELAPSSAATAHDFRVGVSHGGTGTVTAET